ncbi:hypothetical protein Dsin_004642 [Dipteronia sinensis]|uniref:Pentatricopeptide repeat-containing protein n=1 Tax=Dipteronia sinensis TaxID=43782 RepID=A0AAE0AVU4_9ROSI|nr:hypothetical protein Dsin_004642 [Dipteronia sinensis]
MEHRLISLNCCSNHLIITNLRSLLNESLTFNQAKQIHAFILINGLNHIEPLLVRQIVLSTRIFSTSIALFVKQILYHSRKPDAFSWSFAIRFLSQHGQFKEAFSLYVQQQRLGLYPSSFAFSSALKACAWSVFKMGGLSIHAQVDKYGFCGCVYVQTALVDLYSKLGDMNTAQKVFDKMVEKNVVSWNSILSGHLKSGNIIEARRVFDHMPKKDVISWNSILSGYAKMGNIDEAFSLFQRMPERNFASWNALISGYVDSGNIESARSLFDVMSRRNSISWITMIAGYSKWGDVASARELFDQLGEKDLLTFNAMIACYAQNSQPKEVLQLFNEMLEADIKFQPNNYTFASVISACSQIGDIRSGSWIEMYMKKFGIEMNDHLATALIDLYAKCGDINKAYDQFDGLRKKDLVAYTAMIFGCGINGKAVDAIKLFEEMVDNQIYPNLATFTGLLTAFNHAGLVEEGYQCFSSMKDHGLVPSNDHYGIMVDLLGRAGRLEEAYKLIKNMPMQPNVGVWGALLLASSLHNNVEFGEIAAQYCFKLEPDTIAYKSSLANIYASVGRWDDSRRLRKIIKGKNSTKIPGCSWTEVS